MSEMEMRADLVLHTEHFKLDIGGARVIVDADSHGARIVLPASATSSLVIHYDQPVSVEEHGGLHGIASRVWEQLKKALSGAQLVPTSSVDASPDVAPVLREIPDVVEVQRDNAGSVVATKPAQLVMHDVVVRGGGGEAVMRETVQKPMRVSRVFVTARYVDTSADASSDVQVTGMDALVGATFAVGAQLQLEVTNPTTRDVQVGALVVADVAE